MSLPRIPLSPVPRPRDPLATVGTVVAYLIVAWVVFSGACAAFSAVRWAW